MNKFIKILNAVLITVFCGYLLTYSMMLFILVHKIEEFKELWFLPLVFLLFNIFFVSNAYDTGKEKAIEEFEKHSGGEKN